MESKHPKNSEQPAKADHNLTAHPMVHWIGPDDAQWHWLLANLNAAASSPAAIDSALGPNSNLAREGAPNDASIAFGAMRGGTSKVLAAVNGRLDPLVEIFIGWETQWQNRIVEQSVTGTKAKRTRKASAKRAAGDSAGAAFSSDPTLKSISADVLGGPFVDRFGLVLGDFWPGQRRTFPLPDWCVPFYWYELFDRILPWVHQRSGPTREALPSFEKSQSIQSYGQANRGRTNARVDRLLKDASGLVLSADSQTILKGANALVLSDTVTASELWESLLLPQRVNLVVGHPQSMYFRTSPDWVIIDIASPPRQRLRTMPIGLSDRTDSGKLLHWQTDRVDDNIANLISKVRNRYPEALVIALDAFPTWKSWDFYLTQGADLLIPKPFHWYGLLWCLEHWLTTRQQVRISVD